MTTTVSEQSERSVRSKLNNRPWTVTILALGVLSLAIFNLLGFIQVVSNWNYLRSFADYLPFLIAIPRLIWFLLGIAMTWGLWTGRRWASALTRWSTLAYLLYLWLNRIFLFRTSIKTANDPFILVLSVLAIVIVFWILLSRPAKTYFGVNDGHRIE